MRRHLVLTAILCLSAGVAVAKDPALLSVSAEHFKDTATVSENAVDGTVTISTERGYAQHTGPLRTVWNDEFLTGSVNTKTGQRSFFVNAWVTYSGKLRNYQSVAYRGADGTQVMPVLQYRVGSIGCSTGECTYTEHMKFQIDESLLRRLAAENGGQNTLWRAVYAAQTGVDYVSGFSSAEAAGLLARIEEYGNEPVIIRKANLAPAAAAVSSAAVPIAPVGASAGAVAGTGGVALKMDLGIGGLAVDAGDAQSNRAGVLVTAVNRGSPAQRAGMIVGDIVYEINGHAVTSVADLQASVAAFTPGSSTNVRFYRGTASMAASVQF